MDNKLSFTFFISFWSFVLSAQNPGPWMDPSKTYYKIPISAEGIYRVDYNQLLNSGFPVSSVDPRNLQIFHRGDELSILVEGQNDAQFNQNDFIEFYAQANDGKLDKYLYQNSDMQPHDYYNLFSDTTAYFLTWGYGQERGKRISVINENNVQNLPPEEYVLLENRLLLTNDYSRGFAIQGTFKKKIPSSGFNSNARTKG